MPKMLIRNPIQENLFKKLQIPTPDGRQLKHKTIHDLISRLNMLQQEFNNTTSLDFLKDVDTVHQALIKKYPNIGTRKTYVSNITTIISPMGYNIWLEGYAESGLEYRRILEKYAKETALQVIQQNATPKEISNWATKDELYKVVNRLRLRIEHKGYHSLSGDRFVPLIFGKETKHRNLIRDYMVGTLYTSDYTARNIYGDMRIIAKSDYDKMKGLDLMNNYLVIENKDNKQFCYGNSKTSWVYSRVDNTKIWRGVVKIALSSKLNKVVNLYLNYHKQTHLLMNTRGKPLTSTGLTKLLQKIFAPTGKVISSAILRKIFYTDEHAGDVPLINKMATAKKMGNSVGVGETHYSKKNVVLDFG